MGTYRVANLIVAALPRFAANAILNGRIIA